MSDRAGVLLTHPFAVRSSCGAGRHRNVTGELRPRRSPLTKGWVGSTELGRSPFDRQGDVPPRVEARACRALAAGVASSLAGPGRCPTPRAAAWTARVLGVCGQGNASRRANSVRVTVMVRVPRSTSRAWVFSTRSEKVSSPGRVVSWVSVGPAPGTCIGRCCLSGRGEVAGDDVGDAASDGGGVVGDSFVVAAEQCYVDCRLHPVGPAVIQ